MEKIAILEILKELNLNEKESIVYLALLETGQTNVTRLSEKSGVNRITIYHILSSLSQKGLASSIDKDYIKNFIAVDPVRLLEILKEKQDKIKAIIPDLQSLKGKTEKKPLVQLYEGKKGIAALLEEFVNNATDEILVYGNFAIAEKTIGYESLHYRNIRISKKIKTKGVTNSLERADFTRNPEWKKLSDIRLLKSLETLSTWTQISGRKVVILSFYKELTGVLIDNEEIANKERFIFDVLWKLAKK